MKILISIMMTAVVAYFVVTLAIWRKKAQKEKSEQQHTANLKSELTRSLLSYLDLQLSLFRDPKGSIPNYARDNFSIGYICGTIDAALQYRNIASISKEELFFIIVPELFGPEHALVTIGRTIYLTENNDPEFLEGCHTGGNEFFDAADRKIRNSLSWFMHLQKKQSEI